MSAAHVSVGRSRASRLQEENYREFTPPLPTTVAKFSSGPGNCLLRRYLLAARIPIRSSNRAVGPYPRHPHEMRLQSRVLNVPCQLHAICRPGACTLTHASANSLIRTQRTSKKHRCWIVAQRRVSCRWSTPQRKAERIPAARGRTENEPRSVLFLPIRPSRTRQKQRSSIWGEMWIAVAEVAECNSSFQYGVVHSERSSGGPFEPPPCRCI
jgi:hypothetical protein